MDVRALVTQANELSAGGAYRLSISLYERVLRDAPTDPAAPEARAGLAAAREGQQRRTCDDKPDRDSRRAADLARQSSRQLGSGQFREAFETASRALEIDDCNPIALEIRETAQGHLPPPGTWTDPSSGLRFRQIPAGVFSMGCTDGDTSCSEDEKPRQWATLSHSFYLNETEITRGAYRRCAGTGNCTSPSLFTWNDATLDGFPMALVTWDEATAFCRWAGGRLPTEAEWERAARGASGGDRYPTGDTLTRSQANWGAESCCSGAQDGADRFVEAAPVGSFPPGSFGLLDLAGNVAEWTADVYGDYRGGSVVDPSGPTSGSLRVVRGGSWIQPSTRLRSSDRQALDSRLRLATVGFRCVRDTVPVH